VTKSLLEVMLGSKRIHAFWLDGIQKIVVALCVGGGHERLARCDLDHGAGSSRQHSQPRLVRSTLYDSQPSIVPSAYLLPRITVYCFIPGINVSNPDSPNPDPGILLNSVLGCC
jgi:hypothetical protein